MNRQQLQRVLNLPDPYLDFVPNKDAISGGWNGNDPIFGDLIRRSRPKLIIEVGTYLGLSALNMAFNLKQLGLKDTCIICVDTWLGSLTHWNDPETFAHLRLKNGYPTLFHDFLSNVVNFELQDYIFPLPMPSTIADKFLRLRNVKADLIYIDGSHDYRDVSYDIDHYWHLLDSGGILFGDDFGWAGVERAVTEFGDKINQPYCTSGPSKWAFIKPTIMKDHMPHILMQDAVRSQGDMRSF